MSDSEIQQKIDEGRPYVVRFVLEKDKNIEFEVELEKEWVVNMLMRVVKFSIGDTKLERFLPKNKIYPKEIIEFWELV